MMGPWTRLLEGITCLQDQIVTVSRSDNLQTYRKPQIGQAGSDGSCRMPGEIERHGEAANVGRGLFATLGLSP
jgi:hypothetical protein